MAEVRIRFNAMDALFRVLAAIAALIAACLTIFAMQSHDEAIIPLLYLLFPGVIASLLIGGGHGGTSTEELMALVFGTLINAAFYALIVMTPRWIWRRLTDQRNKTLNQKG